MPLLRSSAAGVAALALEGTLGLRLAEQFRHARGQSPSPSEIRSWDRSLAVLLQDLVQAGLDRVEVLVEYALPLTSKRADVVLAGRHPRTGAPSYVVVELKQWSGAQSFEGSESLVEVEGWSGQPDLHPVLQVRGYCEYLRDFTRALHDLDDAVAGVAYLHNATDRTVTDLRALPPDTDGRLVTGQRRSDLVRLLQERLDPEADGTPYGDALLSSAVAPSRQLLAVAAEEIQHREQFVLLDQQRLAYEYVLHQVERARAADTKSVVVVTGGPGSGKSVIALSLVGELAREGRTVMHATGSRSFTQTLRQVAGHRSTRTKKLFAYFNSFMAAGSNELDVLVCDEAHRIRETSANRWTRAEHRTGRPQVDELIGAARVPVFLLDEHQVVRPGEIGTVHDVEVAAGARGLPVHQIDLDAQFRCGGSEAYVTWVLRLLGLEPGGPDRWTGDDAFALSVVDGPDAMEHLLAEHQEAGYSARMTAGYCWPWSDPRPDGSLVPDVQVDGWARPWNLKGDRAVGGAPPAALWATDPAGFGQVGCVYTAQGFEYDWNGVVLGPDLVWRDGAWQAVRSANRDPDFSNRTRVSDEDFARLVRNVYKVLLTRGMVGTYVCSTDEETQQHLRALIPAAMVGTLP